MRPCSSPRLGAVARPIANALFASRLGAALGHLLVVLGAFLVRLVAVGGLLLFGSRLTTGVGGVFRLATLLFSRLRAGASVLSVVHHNHLSLVSLVVVPVL